MKQLFAQEKEKWRGIRGTTPSYVGNNFVEQLKKRIADKKHTAFILDKMGISFSSSCLIPFFDINTKKDWNVLEIGCGYGLLGMSLVGKVRKYYGVDIEENAVSGGNQAFKEMGIDNAELFVVNEDGLDIFEDNFFDYIFAENSFIHIPPPLTKQYLKQISHKLKDNGQFNVLLNMKYSGDGVHSHSTHSYTIKEYKLLFENTGLEVLRTLDEKVPFDVYQCGLHIFGSKLKI